MRERAVDHSEELGRVPLGALASLEPADQLLDRLIESFPTWKFEDSHQCLLNSFWKSLSIRFPSENLRKKEQPSVPTQDFRWKLKTVLEILIDKTDYYQYIINAREVEDRGSLDRISLDWITWSNFSIKCLKSCHLIESFINDSINCQNP